MGERGAVVGGNFTLIMGHDATTMALPGLSTVGQTLYVAGGSATEVDLSGLTAVGSLTLWGFGALDSSAFLTEVALTNLQDLVIQSNSGFTSLEGLPQLETITGNLTIFENDALSSLDRGSFLPALRSVGGWALVADNPCLPVSEAEAFIEGLKLGAGADLEGNEGPCYSAGRSG